MRPSGLVLIASATFIAGVTAVLVWRGLDRGPRPRQPPGGITPESMPATVARGDSIFHGLLAQGTCSGCHGQDAKGTPLAPDLTDREWQNGDGSYESTIRIVTNGVPPHPEHGRAGMPALGGVTLTPEQVRSVAAYVYSLSHRGT